jgi:hypothetical protein
VTIRASFRWCSAPPAEIVLVRSRHRGTVPVQIRRQLRPVRRRLQPGRGQGMSASLPPG